MLGSVRLVQWKARGEMEADIPLLPVGRDGAVRGFVGSCPSLLVGAARLLRPLPSVRPLPLGHQARHGSPERALAFVPDLPEEAGAEEETDEPDDHLWGQAFIEPPARGETEMADDAAPPPAEADLIGTGEEAPSPYDDDEVV